MSDGYQVKATPSGENTYLEKQELEFVNEAPPISDGGAHHEVSFVNDWSELEDAVTVIKASLEAGDGADDWDGVPWRDVETLIKYVPRLLTQYANLVELSFALTEGWEQYATLQKPSGLYLPDVWKA